MPRQAIKQATCTECDESDENYTVTDKDMDISEDTLDYDVRCTCGETATISLDSEGTHATDNVSYEDASWNEDSDDSSEDDE